MPIGVSQGDAIVKPDRKEQTGAHKTSQLPGKGITLLAAFDRPHNFSDRRIDVHQEKHVRMIGSEFRADEAGEDYGYFYAAAAQIDAQTFVEFGNSRFAGALGSGIRETAIRGQTGNRYHPATSSAHHLRDHRGGAIGSANQVDIDDSRNIIQR